MDNLHAQLVAARILPDLLDVLSGRPCWLVGGALRDALRGETTKDFDLATPGDPTPIAKAFAARIHGHWFLMDSLRRQSRVVVPREAGGWAFDFAPLRAPTLNEDLRLRDFTVNAVAWPLSPNPPRREEFVDPCGGLADIEFRRLRACSARVFHDDPLRVLRGVRLAATLGMEIESATFALMGEAAAKLDQTAAERIQAELALIFAARGGECLARLRDLDLSPLLFGPCAARGSWESGVSRVARIVAGLEQGAGELLAEFPEEEGEGSWSAVVLLKLAALLAGYRPTIDVGEHLRLSRRAGNLLRRLREVPPETLAELHPLRDTTPRRRALWVEQLGAEPVLGLTWLLSQADDPRRWLPEARRVLTDYRDHLRHGRIPDLVDGAWVRQQLGLSDGRRIGETLRKLRAAELSGHVKTPDEARKFLESLVEKNIDKEIDPP